MDINTLKQEIEQLKVAKEKELASGAKISSFNEDELLIKYTDLLTELRKDGVHRVEELNQQIVATKKNRMLEPAEKTSLIEGYKAEIEKAKTVVEANKSEDAKYSKEAVAYSNALYKVYSKQVNKEENEKQVQWIIENLPFEVVSMKEELPEEIKAEEGEFGLQLLPGIHKTDGFFLCKLRRIG